MTTSKRVEAYLAQLGRELSQRGPLDARVIEEARGHLMDMIETGVDRGLSAGAAEDDAFARFGSPDVVAASFTPKRLRLLNGIVVVACSLTALATAYLSLSVIVLHPPHVSYQTWFPVATFLIAQSMLTLAVVTGRARGSVARASLLPGSIVSLFFGVWWVRDTVAAHHFEGYAVVLGSWVAVQGVLTLLRLAQWRHKMVRTIGCLGVVVLLSATAFGQGTDAPPKFESADVHGVPANGLGVSMAGGALRSGRYEIRGATMVDLVKTAYGVDDDKVVGGPSWLETDRFDVIATAPAGATADAAKVMLQNLLADRFGLTVHKDNKPMPAYLLSAGKGAAKLKPASGSSQTGCQPQPPSAPPAPGVIVNGIVSCHNMTMALLADQLHQMAGGYVGDHPVVDATKLEGSWDFDLTWTARQQLAAAGSDGISLFDAVDKQLGLKLDLQTVSMPVVVVDKVSQKPTANLAGVGSSVPDAPPEFEAADIKPSAPGAQGFRFQYQPGGRVSGEGALRDFVGFALGIPPNLSADLLVGVPKPLETARFEIIAKTPATGIGAATHDGGRDTPPPLSVALVMLHALLTDRFKLVTHTEDQMATVYAISLPKGAQPKLKKADAMERASCKPEPNAPAIGAAGAPTVAWRCQNTTMADLAANVQQWANGYFDHPAVNTTGLEGGWDFVLSWTPKGALHPAQTGDPSVGIAADPGGLSVFEAIEKELGLKVDIGKHTIPVNVIDHMELKPTDN